MQITVKVTPNAKSPSIVRADDGSYKVRVDARAVEGRANKRLIELLAEHFGVSKHGVRILRGENSRNKVIEIDL
jgi:uncharacterized protein